MDFSIWAVIGNRTGGELEILALFRIIIWTRLATFASRTKESSETSPLYECITGGHVYNVSLFLEGDIYWTYVCIRQVAGMFVAFISSLIHNI